MSGSNPVAARVPAPRRRPIIAALPTKLGAIGAGAEAVSRRLPGSRWTRARPASEGTHRNAEPEVPSP